MRLLEDRSKAWLRARGLPVPIGYAAHSVVEASAIGERLGKQVVAKALVATGRRGKAGAVQHCSNADQLRTAADNLLRMQVNGHAASGVYIEEAVQIQAEFFLSYGFGEVGPRLIVSCFGGVDIETEVALGSSQATVCDINPVRGITQWDAMGLWERVGADRKHLVALASITVNLYHAFTEADALLLEVNPLVITMQDTLSIVGLMMEIDASALYRHQEWSDPDGEAIGLGGRPVTARERLVLEANKALTGGAIRYTELDGDIALLVGGGGAGLHQHDLLTLEGAWPANHSDLSPSPTPDKPAVLFDAVLAHPNVRGMLLGVNLLQLAPCDLLVKAMLIALKRSDKDPKRFPIVIRLFGPREKEARELAASIPGVQYLPYGASLRDGVRAIVSAMSGVNNQ